MNPLPVPANNPAHSAPYAKGWTDRAPLSDAVYLAGWRDCDVATLAAIAHPPVVAPPVEANPVLTPLVDFATRLRAAKAGDTISVAGPEVLSSPVSIVVDGVKLIGANANAHITITSLADAQGHPASTAISVTGKNFECGGITFNSNKPLEVVGPGKVGINVFRVTGTGFNVHDCSASNIDDFVFLEPTASGARITNCPGKDKTIRGDYIYVAGTPDVVITDSGGLGSQQEHWIRTELTEDGKNTAVVTITKGTYSNFDGKESVAARNALSVTLDDVDLDAWARGGQVAAAGQPAPAMSVGKFVANNVRLHNKAYFEFAQGCLDVTLTNVTADNYNGYCPVHVQGPNVKVVGTVTLKDMEATTSHDKVMINGLGPKDLVSIV